jgi:hypothetical protein
MRIPFQQLHYHIARFCGEVTVGNSIMRGTFDRVFDPPHAVSAFEEAQMKGRRGYLIIAALLTILDLAVVVCYSWPVWTTWSGDPWNRGILVLLAALGATSLANVWAQVIPAPNGPPYGRRADREKTAAGIQVEARGHANV